MHEIGTVRTSLVFRELRHHRDTVEESLCLVRPYWIFRSPSKTGCWPSYGVRGMATCWPCTSCCCVPPVEHRPKLPHFCSAPARACTALCTPTALSGSTPCATSRPPRRHG